MKPKTHTLLIFIISISILIGVASIGAVAQDSFDDAETISEGETQGEITNGESDFYEFDANDVDAVDLSVAAESDDIELYVYNEGRDTVVTDTGFSSQTREVTKKLPETGTYFIEIRGDGEQVTTDYTIDLNIVTPEENDQFAPNDDFDSAAELTEGFSDATIWGGESDFYEFDANDVDAVDLSVAAESDDIELYVYDEGRDTIVTDTGFSSQTREVTKKLPETGTYFVEVRGDGEQVTTDYTIDLNIVTPEENDQFAPNDDFDSAAAIPDQFNDATIWGGESDFFKVGLNTSEELDVEVTAESDDVLLRVYGPDRSAVAADDSFSSSTREITLEPDESGNFFVEVEGDGEQVTTDYTLQSNRTGAFEKEEPDGPADEHESGVDRDVFDTIDQDGDGQITLEELVEANIERLNDPNNKVNGVEVTLEDLVELNIWRLN